MLDQEQWRQLMQIVATGAAAFAGAWMRSATLTAEVNKVRWRIDVIDERLDAIEERLAKIEAKMLNAIEERLIKIEAKLPGV